LIDLRKGVSKEEDIESSELHYNGWVANPSASHLEKARKGKIHPGKASYHPP
jgi:hypothetical protein